VGAIIRKYDAAPISMPPLTHDGALNYPGALNNLTRASDDEKSGSPFLNLEKWSR
jgi:hypothetical protein